MVIPYFGRQRFYHTDLLDMPSITNADHDGRYLLLTGGTLTGNLTLGGILTANGNAEFNNPATINDRLNMAGHIYMGNGQEIVWDTNDYVYYNRSNNHWIVVIGGVARIYVDIYGIHSAVLWSTVSTGTIPVSVVSTTKCTNLNVDRLDNYHAGNSSGQVAVSNGNVCNNLNADEVDGYDAGNSSGQVAVSNGTVCNNLNADKIDGKDIDNIFYTATNVGAGAYYPLNYSNSKGSVATANIVMLTLYVAGYTGGDVTGYWNDVTGTGWVYIMRNDSGGTQTMGAQGIRSST